MPGSRVRFPPFPPISLGSVLDTTVTIYTDDMGNKHLGSEWALGTFEAVALVVEEAGSEFVKPTAGPLMNRFAASALGESC